VRRPDAAWGQTRAEAKRAAQETFFFTNCSPQHSTLNQRTWLSLEDYLLCNASTHDLKVSVFSGPVMNENDHHYRGVRIPEEFWKIAVSVNAFTGKLSATGYILNQANYLGDFEFVSEEFKTY
jgi:endonuclease G